MFLGTDIGWVDVMEYHDADGSCAISMQELGNVCKTHYQACLSFLQNSHTTKGAPHDSPTSAAQTAAATIVTTRALRPAQTAPCSAATRR